MNLFLYTKKIFHDQEFHLYELLKVKKKLETQFLSNYSNEIVQSFRFKIKIIILTKNIALLFSNNIINLITSIELFLGQKFSTYKRKEEEFLIRAIPSSTKNEFPLFFDNLIKYNNRLEIYNASLIIQGSYADGNQLSYSDVDLVIIGSLSKSIIEIKKEIEQELVNLDPLQHHGVFFINSNSFSNYWQMDLPIETLKKAVLLSKKRSLTINVSYSFEEKYSSYNWVHNFIKQHPILPIALDSGVFYVKYFISQLLLVPALFLAFKGSYVYKKESFELAKKHYSSTSWRCIEIASTIRREWNQDGISKNYILKRKNSLTKDVKEYNNLTDVINLKQQDLIEFSDSYSLFIKETNNLLVPSPISI